MREMKIYCDHCGKTINELHDYLDTEICFYGNETADLCKSCICELDDVIKKFCNKGGAE